jgi:hypothetical protein
VDEGKKAHAGGISNLGATLPASEIAYLRVPLQKPARAVTGSPSPADDRLQWLFE